MRNGADNPVTELWLSSARRVRSLDRQEIGLAQGQGAPPARSVLVVFEDVGGGRGGQGPVEP